MNISICEIWHFGWPSVYMWPWFLVFRPNLPDFPQSHKNTKTDTLVKLHLMWNMEFNLLGGFWCICALYLGFMSPISMAWLIEYTKTGIYNSIIRYGLYTGVRLHLMPDLQFNTLDDFLYMHTHDQGYLGLICLISPNPPIPQT